MKSKLLPITYSTALPPQMKLHTSLLSKIKSIHCSILESIDATVTKILFRDNPLSNSSNTLILN